MTAKKDLKRRVRERMAQTGERYTTALERVRAEPSPAPKRSLIERAPPPHDLSAIARGEGFETCEIAIGEPTWLRVEGEEGGAEAWFRLVFERLRQLLVASIGEPGPDALRARLVLGERLADRALVYPYAFLRKVRSGVRGVSTDGTVAAFDVPRREGPPCLVVFWCITRKQADGTVNVLSLQIDPDLSFTQPETWLALLHRFARPVR